jgi:phosphoribosylformimino-5-aminoimidazole carboxamide ribonucleotide (ProFAR) isomerase
VIELYPAIDLRDGKVVRLRQGDYDDQTTYGDDPVAVATSFADAGAPWIHVVDLDAARSGSPLNRPVVAAITAAVAGRARVQTGGGVRTLDDARALAEAGVARVVMGSAAVDGIAGVITGKALYEGRFTVPEALLELEAASCR